MAASTASPPGFWQVQIYHSEIGYGDCGIFPLAPTESERLATVRYEAGEQRPQGSGFVQLLTARYNVCVPARRRL
jgi:hypothetical protein